LILALRRFSIDSVCRSLSHRLFYHWSIDSSWIAPSLSLSLGITQYRSVRPAEK
jgi:hypothetical protein